MNRRFTRLLGVLSAIVLITSLIVIIPGGNQIALAWSSTTQYKITAVHSGKALDVSGVSTANGALVHQWDYVGGANQHWYLVDVGGGWHRITAAHSGKALDVSNVSTANGAQIHQWDYVGGANQQWAIVDVGGGKYRITSRHSGKALDVSGVSTANGALVHQWDYVGGANQQWYITAVGSAPPPSSGFPVSEAQFNQMFPNRNSFYTYSGLVSASNSIAGFASTGSDTIKKQEMAAFLANVNHETGGLVHIVEQNTANYSHYCDWSQPYGCPAGQSAYYGRGPIQLSWNFNYKAAGDWLGSNLLNDPWQVQNNATIAWKTAIWYWMTQNGPGPMTAHNAMINSSGFGYTIRAINGALECDGKNPAQVQSRVSAYQNFASILGVSPGGNLYC